MTCSSIYRVGGNWLHCGLEEGHPSDTHSFAVEWKTSEEYVPPPPPPTIEEQLERLKTKFPDAELIKLEYGFIVKFTLKLPKGKYNQNSTWVAFEVPPGFPAAHPSNFYTDKDLRYEYGGFLNRSGNSNHPKLGHCTLVFGHVQAWNPNSCTLFTYAMVVKHAIERGMFWREEKWDDSE